MEILVQLVSLKVLSKEKKKWTNYIWHLLSRIKKNIGLSMILKDHWNWKNVFVETLMEIKEMGR